MIGRRHAPCDRLEINDNRFNENRSFSIGNCSSLTCAMLSMSSVAKAGLSEASLDRVHDRLIGRPGPCVGLTKLPDYMRSFDDVWSLTPRPTLPFNSAANSYRVQKRRGLPRRKRPVCEQLLPTDCRLPKLFQPREKSRPTIGQVLCHDHPASFRDDNRSAASLRRIRLSRLPRRRPRV